MQHASVQTTSVLRPIVYIIVIIAQRFWNKRSLRLRPSLDIVLDFIENFPGRELIGKCLRDWAPWQLLSHLIFDSTSDILLPVLSSSLLACDLCKYNEKMSCSGPELSLLCPLATPTLLLLFDNLHFAANIRKLSQLGKTIHVYDLCLTIPQSHLSTLKWQIDRLTIFQTTSNYF